LPQAGASWPADIGLENKSFEIALPDFGGSRRKDVLFFTPGDVDAPQLRRAVDRALAIATELADNQAFRMVVLDVMRVLKGGRTFADSLGTHPKHFGDLYVNIVPRRRGLRFARHCL
jgi:general secretion pathway protein F